MYTLENHDDSGTSRISRASGTIECGSHDLARGHLARLFVLPCLFIGLFRENISVRFPIFRDQHKVHGSEKVNYFDSLIREEV